MKLLAPQLLCVLCLYVQYINGNPLIHDYQLISPDSMTFVYPGNSHSKRSAMYTQQPLFDEEINVKVILFDKHYTLLLNKSPPPVQHYDNFTVKGKKMNVDRFYTGVVSGRPKSVVRGFIDSKNYFEGRVTIGNETILIESTNLVSSDRDTIEQFPVVAIRDRDLDAKNFEGGSCGVSKFDELSALDQIPLERERRGSPKSAPKDNTCEILAIADHTFSAAYDDNIVDIINAMTYYVNEGDNIFRSTVFGDVKGYGVKIGRAEVFTGADVNSDGYPYKDLGKSGSSDFLKRTMEWNRDANHQSTYCLVYAFTNRDFDGVLGEAYIGQTCRRAYNTGIVSMSLSGSRRPKLLVALTYTHETGHSWGSNHDKTPECTPGKPEGNYLMYYQATTGMRQNNPYFSICSRTSISYSLRSRSATSCFTEIQAGFCGNNVAEEKEQCDCGFEDAAGGCWDKCCIPASVNNDNSNQCMLKGNSKCSPSKDLCCTESCGVTLAGEVCGDKEECAEERRCPGGDISVCPKAKPVENGKLCANNTHACHNGTCMASPCISLYPKGDYTECTCGESQISDGKTAGCVVCCKSDVQACKPINKLDVTWSEELFVSPGDLCTNEAGYCDIFHRCRKYSEEGALLKVIQNLFSSEKWSDFGRTYWWAIVLAVVAFILIIAVFVHVAAIYTPTQNPNVKKYTGPKHYTMKKYSSMKAKRELSRDQPDAAKPPPTSSVDRRQRVRSMVTQKRRVVVYDRKETVA